MNVRLGWSLLLIAVASAGIGYGLRWGQESSSGVPGAPASGAVLDLAGKEQVARRHCAGCHLFPEPHLLSRQEWLHHILPAMAIRLGIEPTNYESLQEGRLIEAAQVFPSRPQVSAEEWFTIWDYYRNAAPVEPLGFPRTVPQHQSLDLFDVERFSFHQGAPTICLVHIDEQARRLYVGDSYAKMLAAVDPSGRVLQRIALPSGPVAMARGGQGWYVALIGHIYPSDLPEGEVVWFSDQLGQGAIKPLLGSLRRPTDVQVGDLTGDGLEDLVVCEFGNHLGRLSWFENLGSDRFEGHVLLEQPGAVRAELSDFNGDGRLDILVLMAQAREGIYLFTNEGSGKFQARPILERHPLFGYAGLQVVDFDGDGQMDILTANGDNGDYPTPHKAYHGVRLHLNRGLAGFEEVFFYPLPGAYQAVAADFDGDGDHDIAAISFFPDFEAPTLESFVYLENNGGLRFTPRTLPAQRDGRWMRMEAGDLDGDGDIDLVLGAFALGPTTVPVPEEVRARWRENQTPVLVLRNRSFPFSK